MIIDTHSHCYWDTLAPRIEEIIASMKTHGITHAIQIGCDVDAAHKSLELSRKYPEFFRATIGYHPEHAQNLTQEKAEEELQILDALIEENKDIVVAIGECGLDYHYLGENRIEQIAIQNYVWRYQVELGKKYNLPLVIHSRDAREDTLKFIKSE